MLKILIADDNGDAADTLAELMKLLGHQVEVAYRGDHAVEIADRMRPDVVFLDIAMPGLTGLEVCRHIRGRSWGAKTVVIAVTGFGRFQDYEAASEAGFDYHCTKPVTFTTVQGMLPKAAPG